MGLKEWRGLQGVMDSLQPVKVAGLKWQEKIILKPGNLVLRALTFPIKPRC